MQLSTDRSYRQGDILLLPCSEIPLNAIPESPEDGLVVLARGETSGHRHVIGANNVTFFREDGSGGGYIRVTGPGAGRFIA